MNSIVLLALSLYLAEFRLAIPGAINFAWPLGTSHFLFILSVFSCGSDGEKMQR